MRFCCIDPFCISFNRFHSGITQAFFPVPYAYYDPNIVYRQTKVPDVIPIHKDTGHWAQGERDMACFDNKDYKDMRVNSEDFLKEDNSNSRDLMQVGTFFPKSNWT